MEFLYAKCVFEHVIVDRMMGHVPASLAAQKCLETSLINASFTTVHGIGRLCSVPRVISLPGFELNAVASCRNEQAPSLPLVQAGLLFAEVMTSTASHIRSDVAAGGQIF